MTYRFGLLYTKAEMLRIRNSAVSLAGLGGYGSALIDPLARYQFAELRLADPDRFEMANMDRQTLARLSTLNLAKVDVASSVICDISPDTKVRAFGSGVTPATAHDFCCRADVVIDVCDSLAARLLLHWECSRLRIPLVTGGARSWPSRIGTRVSSHRYDKDERFDVTHFPYRKWGLSSSTWRRYRLELAEGRLEAVTVKDIDAENADFRLRYPPNRLDGTAQSGLAGGYDPLKVVALSAGLIEELLAVLISRRPQHHRMQRKRQF